MGWNEQNQKQQAWGANSVVCGPETCEPDYTTPTGLFKHTIEKLDFLVHLSEIVSEKTLSKLNPLLMGEIPVPKESSTGAVEECFPPFFDALRNRMKHIENSLDKIDRALNRFPD